MLLWEIYKLEKKHGYDYFGVLDLDGGVNLQPPVDMLRVFDHTHDWDVVSFDWDTYYDLWWLRIHEKRDNCASMASCHTCLYKEGLFDKLR